MSVSPISIEKPRTGTCPHGNPAGTCPICSGMGGGGGKVSNDHNTRRNPGEMTWNECYAMGLLLKQRALNEANANQQTEMQKNILAQAPIVGSVIAKLSNVANNISAFFSNLVTSTQQKVVAPTLKALQNFTETVNEKLTKFADSIKNKIADLRQKIIDISDKLTAILGELKNAIEKKIADGFKRQLKKVTGLLNLILPTSQTSENQEDDERKHITQYELENKKIVFNTQQLQEDKE